MASGSLLVCLGNRKWNCTSCCLSAKFPSGWRQRCVSSAPCLQVWVPAGSPVKHSSSSTVPLPFLPLFSSRSWSFLPASCLLLFCCVPLMSAETQSDSFLCLKIQTSKAVSTVDRFTRQKWALVVKYSPRSQLEVRSCCYSSLFVFPFPDQYLHSWYLRSLGLRPHIHRYFRKGGFLRSLLLLLLLLLKKKKSPSIWKCKSTIEVVSSMPNQQQQV